MAKVTMRLYSREIESMIDHGKVEEAIAHCKHILQSYPKYIEIYRLLAKAFLESQRYSEASDIFQRVLSAVPDDFVSQVGMSIIRENEGNLDGAIWHMERSFEVQPSNITVQDELRRLYQRRDGVNPPRIRLTRGALARMYAKGDLYPQAIAEIQSTLVTEPNRPDLQVLLARLCLQVGQRIESTEICSELLSKYPYCLEANRILSQILPKTTRAEDAKIYLNRIIALDPYSAFLPSNLLSSKDIPENAVMIERLDYKPGTKIETGKSEWASSLSLVTADNAKPTEESLPAWLSAIEESPKPVETEKLEPQKVNPAPVGLEDNNEFLTQDSSGKIEELPPWLQDITPSSLVTETKIEKTPAPDMSREQGMPDWLREIQSSQSTPSASSENPMTGPFAPTPVDGLPDWLNAAEIVPPIEAAPIAATHNLEPEDTHPESLQEMPQWLRDLKTLAPSESPITAPSTLEASPTPFAPETLDAQPSGIEDLSDSPLALPTESQPIRVIPPSESISASEAASQGTRETPQNTSLPFIDIPEWLNELGKGQPLPILASGTNIASVEEASQVSEQTPDEVSSLPSRAEAEPSSPPAEVLLPVEEKDAAPSLVDSPTVKSDSEEDLSLSRPDMRIDKPSSQIQHDAEEIIGQPMTQSQMIPEPPIITPAPDSETSDLPEWLLEVLASQEAALTPEQKPGNPGEPVDNLPEWIHEFNHPLEIVKSQAPAQSTPIEEDNQETIGFENLLRRSQAAFVDGKVELGLDGYSQLINKGFFVDETIHDLKDALSRFPEDISIWQELGDAYVRVNRLQDALDAFTKAEELFR